MSRSGFSHLFSNDTQLDIQFDLKNDADETTDDEIDDQQRCFPQETTGNYLIPRLFERFFLGCILALVNGMLLKASQ